MAVAGKDLPPNARLQLIWESYDARWAIEQRDGQDWNEFNGINFNQRIELITAVETDDQGSLHTSFVVPEDYGGVHDVYLIDPHQDQKVNKAGFRLDPNVTLTPQSGPLGAPLTVTMTGLNAAHPMEGWYRIWYDNVQAGLLTAVSTRGTAQAIIPAVGRAGKHLIEVKTGAMGQASFLQVDVSPFAYLPLFKFEFALTAGPPLLPAPIEEQLQPENPVSEPDSALGRPLLWTDYTNVPARSALGLSGRGLPPDTTLELFWVDMESNDVNEDFFNTRYSGRRSAIGQVRTDEHGRFSYRFVPESLQGGARAIEAQLDGRLLAKTYVRMTPWPYRLARKSYAIGDPMELEIDGVGWTETEKILCLVYDNSYIGYVCGNDLMGKVVAKFSATGAPGWHFLQVYPAIYKKKDYADAFETPFLYRLPLLNWQDLPHGFHCNYAFQVTEK
ncbi:MAG TPA: hypothetical protein ENI60_06820 [Candidatus Fraserbacteria bacterium]|nr:hypothetical protein [Candidatus Fraserbacteria bacterium]